MPTIGETLAGRYRVDAPLGAGGMATVHRGRDLRLDRDVAIKVLLPNLAGDPVIAERFDREARALAAISHPNVVAVFDVEPGDPATGQQPFFVMELCERGSLADRLAVAGGRLPPDEVIPIISSIADGLDALHGAGLLHRDVKPHNVLLSDDRARLGDLGLAQAEDALGWNALTASGTALGTLAYLAPERLAGRPATPAADVWALGAMTYQALTGQMPRPAATVAELAERLSETPAPPSAAQPELGTAFDRPLLAALDPAPSNRPAALAFGSSLASALGRWSRSGRGTVRPAVPPFPAAPLTASAAAAAADASATTAVVRSTGQRSLAPSTARRAGWTRPSTMSLAGIAIVALAIVAAAILARFGLLAFAPGPSAQGSGVAIQATATPSPSASPSRSPSPRPTPTRSPTPPPDPFAAARQRLADVRAAIEAAKGGGGLKGKDANRLRDLAGRVDQQISKGDPEAAASAADDLLAAVQDDIDKDRVGGDAGDRLLAAARALRDSIPDG